MTASIHQITTTLKLDKNLALSTDQALGQLARSAFGREYKKGEFVFREGDASDHFFLVESGRVILSRQTHSGKAFTFLIAVKGMPLNAVTCFRSRPRSFSAKVAAKSRVIAIPSDVFRKWVLTQPRVAEGILDTMAGHLDSTYTRILGLIDQSAENRILNALNMLEDKIGSTLPLTNTDIAEMTGVSRETAARIISNLNKSNLVTKSRGSLKLVDKDALQKRCTSPFFTL